MEAKPAIGDTAVIEPAAVTAAKMPQKNAGGGMPAAAESGNAETASVGDNSLTSCEDDEDTLSLTQGNTLHSPRNNYINRCRSDASVSIRLFR